jgi:hypothetical protein
MSQCGLAPIMTAASNDDLEFIFAVQTNRDDDILIVVYSDQNLGKTHGKPPVPEIAVEQFFKIRIGGSCDHAFAVFLKAFIFIRRVRRGSDRP